MVFLIPCFRNAYVLLLFLGIFFGTCEPYDCFNWYERTIQPLTFCPNDSCVRPKHEYKHWSHWYLCFHFCLLNLTFEYFHGFCYKWNKKNAFYVIKWCFNDLYYRTLAISNFHHVELFFPVPLITLYIN